MPLTHTSMQSIKPSLVTPFTATKRPAIPHQRTLVIVADSTKPSYAVTGATGFVGSRLVSRLAAQGSIVNVLTRNVQRAKSVLPYPNVQYFDPRDWQAGIENTAGVVNLAGEPISTRWTPEIKKEIKASRVQTTSKIVDIINRLEPAQRPPVLVSSSAVGYYGISDTATFTEASPAGNDFLAEVCKDWEAAAEAAQVDRLVIIRTGIVLGRDGGALARMLPVFRLFVGGPIGTGSQWCSWIHRDDLVALLIEALKNPEYKGVYNGTAPSPVRMNQLCSSLGSSLGRPSWLPVPDYAIQTLLGEGASVVLEGQKVVPTRTKEAGFAFKYNTVDEALKAIL